MIVIQNQLVLDVAHAALLEIRFCGANDPVILCIARDKDKFQVTKITYSKRYCSGPLNSRARNILHVKMFQIDGIVSDTCLQLAY